MAAAGIQTDVGHIDNKILEAFAERLNHPFAVDLETDDPDRIAVYVQIKPGLLTVVAARKRVTSTTTWLLLAWMVGGSVVLAAIAIYLPAPAGPADPPARQRRRQLRQGSRRRRFPAARARWRSARRRTPST